MKQDEIRRQELSDFLRSRRARVSPADAGLPVSPRRRTAGLRREEVAQLAGISVTWYTWLEQKRPIKVSGSTLDNVARVLRLDPVERIQLFQLALRQPVVDTASQQETVSPLLQRMLDQTPMPAFVLGRRCDVLAWNLAARAFLIDFQKISADERNLVWLYFTDPALRSLMVDWPTRAQGVIALFRCDYGRHAGDAYFVELVQRLIAISPEFAEYWPRYDLSSMTDKSRQYRHPLVGSMVLDSMMFSVVEKPEQRISVLLPSAKADSVNKMQILIEAFRSAESDISPVSQTSRKERKIVQVSLPS
jgi:transcriptional regulator with XRE-family HTH domain